MPAVPPLDELRTWSNDRLFAARDEAALAERRARITRVLIDRALDERGAIKARNASEWVAVRDKVTRQTARGEVEVGRALESLPAIAAAATAGRLSMEQLIPLVQLATPETDAEWAARAEPTMPSELLRLLRRKRVVPPSEMRDREERKSFRWWRTKDGTGIRLSGELFDLDAAFVEAVFEHEIEQLRPPKGQPWEPRGKRGAIALVELCRRAKGGAGAGASKKGWRPTVVVHVGSDAQPTVHGMPIDTATVESLLRDGAKVRTVRDDDPLAPTRGDAIPVGLREYLKGRDATCRVPGCGRTFGLEAHHIVPRSHGGRTDKHNVVLVCSTDHPDLVPHGPWVLDGDPEAPDGLRMRRIDEGGAEARAGPAA